MKELKWIDDYILTTNDISEIEIKKIEDEINSIEDNVIKNLQLGKDRDIFYLGFDVVINEENFKLLDITEEEFKEAIEENSYDDPIYEKFIEHRMKVLDNLFSIISDIEDRIDIEENIE